MRSFGSFLFGSTARTGITAASTALMLVMALIFTPLGSAAEGLLGTFRVQKFATVSIDPSTLPDSKALEQFKKPDAFGKVTITTQPELKHPKDLAEAQAIVGYKPQELDTAKLPAEIKKMPELLLVNTGGTATYMPDYDNIRVALDALGGSTVNLPAALRGSTITYQIKPGVATIYSNQTISDTRLNPGQKVIGLLQTPSPVVSTPDGVDLNKLGDELLKLPNLPADLVSQLSQINDLDNTLVIPIPKGRATSRMQKLLPGDTNEALIITGSNNEGSAVIFERNGMIYVVSGNYPAATLVTLAQSLK